MSATTKSPGYPATDCTGFLCCTDRQIYFASEKNWSQLHRFEDILGQTTQDEDSCTKSQLEDGSLVVEDDVEEGTVHVHPAVVFNEAQFEELIHEETDTGAYGTDHLSEQFLTDLRDHRFRLAFFSEVGQQQQDPRQPLPAGIDELIH